MARVATHDGMDERRADPESELDRILELQSDARHLVAADALEELENGADPSNRYASDTRGRCANAALDVLRLDLLEERGGFFLDLDAFVLKGADSLLYLIDLAPSGRRRLGGTSLAHVYAQLGDASPDADGELLGRGFRDIEMLLEAMQAFFDEEIGRYTCPGFTPATGSVGVIEGGSAPNIVPDECAVTLDIRTVPGQDNQETLADLEAYVRERVPERDGLQVVFDPPGHDSPSFETAGDHPLVQTACALRGQAVAEVVPYGCDASKLAAAGSPSSIFGPGDIAQAHTKDEFIALTDLEAGTAAYTDLTLKLSH